MDAKQVWRAVLGELQVSLSPANFETTEAPLGKPSGQKTSAVERFVWPSILWIPIFYGLVAHRAAFGKAPLPGVG